MLLRLCQGYRDWRFEVATVVFNDFLSRVSVCNNNYDIYMKMKSLALLPALFLSSLSFPFVWAPRSDTRLPMTLIIDPSICGIFPYIFLIGTVASPFLIPLMRKSSCKPRKNQQFLSAKQETKNLKRQHLLKTHSNPFHRGGRSNRLTCWQIRRK